MEKQQFTPGEDFDNEIAAFLQWLAEDTKAKEIPEMSDEELRLLTEDQKIDLIKSLYVAKRELEEEIEWHEEESGHE
jgi:hypothetical protein